VDLHEGMERRLGLTAQVMSPFKRLAPKSSDEYRHKTISTEILTISTESRRPASRIGIRIDGPVSG
jgi:hypothetical protein